MIEANLKKYKFFVERFCLLHYTQAALTIKKLEKCVLFLEKLQNEASSYLLFACKESPIARKLQLYQEEEQSSFTSTSRVATSNAYQGSPQSSLRFVRARSNNSHHKRDNSPNKF